MSYGACWRSRVATAYDTAPETPPAGDGYGYLVTDERSAGEGTLGFDSTDTERPNVGACP